MGYRLNRLDEPVLMAVQNLGLLSLAFIIDWRVVQSNLETSKVTLFCPKPLSIVKTSKTRFYKLPAARFEYSKKEKIQKISKFLEFFSNF